MVSVEPVWKAVPFGERSAATASSGVSENPCSPPRYYLACLHNNHQHHHESCGSGNAEQASGGSGNAEQASVLRSRTLYYEPDIIETRQAGDFPQLRSSDLIGHCPPKTWLHDPFFQHAPPA